MKYQLICQACNKIFSSESGLYTCPACQSSLRVEYLDPRTVFKDHNQLPGIWKYFSKLPLESESFISMGEGCTPLLHLGNRTSSTIDIWVKNESLNPTGTYKDRPASVSVSKAKELGAKGVVVASDGNAAPAVAAYAAKGDVPCIVLMPQKTPELRYLQAAAYGAKIILIDGSINDCLDIAREIANKTGYHNCCTANTVNPYQIEGNKTLSFEILDQLLEVPDWVAVPVGGGGVLSAVGKGFQEMKKSGRIERIPRILAVQAQNCAPLVAAFSGDGVIRKLEQVQDTIAITIALPYPPDGEMALDYIKQSNGHAIAVTEEEIMSSVFHLSGKHGILSEPSGAVSFSGLMKAHDQGIIQYGEKCVAILTGSGLKTIEAFKKGLENVISVPNDIESVLTKLN